MWIKRPGTLIYNTGIAIPQITTEFNSINDIGWYGSAYLVALMALQTIYGSLYKLFTLKWIYIATLVIFEAGSVVCASAPSSAVFIFGRALAGAGAAGMFSGTLALGGDLVPLRRRPFYISLVAGVNGVASGIAPVIGGLFTSSRALGWRFCFWINLREYRSIGCSEANLLILQSNRRYRRDNDHPQIQVETFIARFAELEDEV